MEIIVNIKALFIVYLRCDFSLAYRVFDSFFLKFCSLSRSCFMRITLERISFRPFKIENDVINSILTPFFPIW